MNRFIFLVLVFVVFLSGCASSTRICTIPEKVKIYSPEGKLLGMTPYNYWDRSPSGTETSFLLKCDGYIDKIISVKKDVLYVHRLILPPLLALPWVLGYEEEYYFELDKKDIPIQEANKTVN